MGQPPEMGQGDADIAGYRHGARAELWRELRDQPLTVGGYCLLALRGGEAMGVKAPRMRLPPHLPGPRLLDQAGLVSAWTGQLPSSSSESPAEVTLLFFLCLILGLQSWSFYFLAV